MKDKHVLVTGGGGYVGTALVPKLLAGSYEVTVVDLFLYGDLLPRHPKLKKIKGDIRDRGLMKKALGNVSRVIHLACISNDPSFELDPKLGRSINYDATVQLINLAREAQIERFIYASSSSVYGVKSEPEVTEELPLEPLTDYSKYKALSEQYLQGNSGNMPYVILRPATVCGYSPRLRLDLTVNILTINALVNKKITVYGGNQKRPNIHIEDMCRAYMLLISTDIAKVNRQTYNVGYQNYSIIEIARMIKKTLGDNSISVRVVPSNDLRSYRVNSQKILRELDFVPTHTVEQAIADLSRAYKRHLIPKPFGNKQYYNIQTMQAIHLH